MIRDPQLRISKLSREVYICLKDVITKKGEEAAMAIYKEKRLQRLVPEGSLEDPRRLKHPELPGIQARNFCLTVLILGFIGVMINNNRAIGGLPDLLRTQTPSPTLRLGEP